LVIVDASCVRNTFRLPVQQAAHDVVVEILVSGQP